GKLLELLYSARNKFDSVQMQWVYAYDINVLHEIFDNQNDKSRTLLKAVDSKRLILPSDHSNFSFVHQKLLIQKQQFMRYERKVDKSEPTTQIVVDKREWNITSSNRRKGRIQYCEKDNSVNVMDEVLEIQAGELLDPSFLLSSHDISVIGEEQFLNREVIRVRVFPRKGKDQGRESYFWHSTNEIEILVDKQRGTMLKYVLKLNASDFAYCTVTKIIFDANIPESDLLAGVN
ncbi:hypothetical protein MNBD_CHLOROFLEXI01-933, partial [hydrothermal vent metagenome]